MAGNSFPENPEKAEMKVVTLTATQVDDSTANKNGYSASDTIEVVAQVLTAGDGTTKDVIQVWSPSHFSFANPSNAGLLNKQYTMALQQTLLFHHQLQFNTRYIDTRC